MPDDAERFLAAVDHPHRNEILALREIILGADPRVSEGIKWNAPSFRIPEYFATFHLRAKDGVQVILHAGAKKRDRPLREGAVHDPESLLQWLGDDRAAVRFRDMGEVEDRRTAFAALVRAWIEHV
ncbi:MAG TPA: DUF1801 domain-containing protein [Longimicrobium sp.]|nr:DUF1801 domain-containing protein [Longimicrobium sp.]